MHRADADWILSYSYSVQRYSYSYSMAVRTSAMPIFDRFGLCCCVPMSWIAILHDDEYEYEYRSSARADSLSTNTRKRTNKALDRSARSSVFGLRRVNSSHSVNANVRPRGPLTRYIDSGAAWRYNGAMEASDGT